MVFSILLWTFLFVHVSITVLYQSLLKIKHPTGFKLNKLWLHAPQIMVICPNTNIISKQINWQDCNADSLSTITAIELQHYFRSCVLNFAKFEMYLRHVNAVYI